MIDRACISLNHSCNLRCRYCHFANKPVSAADADQTFLPAEGIRVIDNMTSYCVSNGLTQFKLGIVGAGEPLLSFNVLKAIVERAKESTDLFALYTITNGVALTDEQIQFFYDNRAIIELNFSLDGYADIHNALRQGYQQTMAAIHRYEKVFMKKPPINATVTRQSINEKARLTDFFNEQGFAKVNFSILVDVADPALAISRDEYAAFLDYCEGAGMVMRQKRSDIGPSYDCTMYGKRCGVGRTNIFITKAGIYPCGRFMGMAAYKLAAYDAPFAEIERRCSEIQPIDSRHCYYDTVYNAEHHAVHDALYDTGYDTVRRKQK